MGHDHVSEKTENLIPPLSQIISSKPKSRLVENFGKINLDMGPRLSRKSRS